MKNNIKNKAAFFDIDGTLFRSSLLVEQFKVLVKRKIIDPEVWFNEVKPAYDKYDNRYDEYDKYIYVLSIQYQQKLKGISIDYIEKLSKEVVENNKDKVYKTTRKAIRKHKEDGYMIFFISGSPDFLVKEFAKDYGADDFIGTDYIFKDEKFTGDINPMWDSENKLRSIKKLTEKYNIDLSQSYAYGDTNGDVSMLRSVGHPIAVNPSYEFLNVLDQDPNLKQKVKVIIERKDVSFHFDLLDRIINYEKF